MRSVVPMRLAKTGYIILSLLMMALGLGLIVNQVLSVSYLGRTAGIIMIIFGVIKIIGYLSKDLYRLAFQYDLAFGMLIICIGIMVICKPDNLIDSLCIAIGIVTLMDGFLKVQISIDAKTFGIKKWWLILAIAIITIAVGVILVFRISDIQKILVIMIGISLLCQGILNLITAVFTVKIIKNQYPDIIDADFEEI